MKTANILGGAGADNGIRVDQLAEARWENGGQIVIAGYPPNIDRISDAIVVVRDKVVLVAHRDFRGFKEAKTGDDLIQLKSAELLTTQPTQPGADLYDGAIDGQFLGYLAEVRPQIAPHKKNAYRSQFIGSDRDVLVCVQNGGVNGLPTYYGLPQYIHSMGKEDFRSGAHKTLPFPDNVQVLLTGTMNVPPRPEAVMLARMNPGSGFLIDFDAGFGNPSGAPIAVEYDGRYLEARYPRGLQINDDYDD